MLQQLITEGRRAQRAGRFDEALSKYSEALGRARAAGHSLEAADVLRWSAAVYSERGDLTTAVELLAESIAVSEAAGLRDRVARGLNVRGTVYVLRGDLEDARREFARARMLAVELNDVGLTAMADMNTAVISNIQGDVDEALARYGSALQCYRRVGDHESASRALNNIGMANVDLDRLDAARQAFDEAADLAGRIGHVSLAAKVELNRAELHLRRQQYEDAREAVERSLSAFRPLRNRAALGEAYKFYGVLCRETGKPQQSDTYFGLSLTLAQSAQDRLLEAETELQWALLDLDERGDQRAGIRRLNRSLRLFRDLSAAREVLDIERRLQKHGHVYMPVVSAWGTALSEGETRLPAGHGERVATYATALAERAGLTGMDLTWIRVGATLHDVGHAAGSDGPGADVAELLGDVSELTRAHTRIGESMVADLEFPEEVLPIVRSHHERWSGGGYPDGLSGLAIPLTARIVSIADTFDTLTSPSRPDRALSKAQSLCVMEQEMAGSFDPDLLSVFQALISDQANGMAE